LRRAHKKKRKRRRNWYEWRGAGRMGGQAGVIAHTY